MEPTQKCVIDLKLWYASHDMAQKDIASAIGVKPPGLADLFSGRSQPTGAQAVAILNFLKEQSPMIKEYGFKTLDEARTVTERLRSEIAQLRSGAPTPRMGEVTPRQPETDGKQPQPVIPPNRGTPMPSSSAPPVLRLDPTANTPWKIGEACKVTTLAVIRQWYGNERDAMRKNILYKVICERRAIEGA